ncbi:MaoC family dehydratase N-terminal domain-containing protein [Streptomyces ovatisporus]|uniref:MaoC family dehydratase N-terminal domain-containing protein n=1 Tax=Streptomyces ovatisporus TaxID=1128682 RepID=A0ABV9AD38_9ACTN
MSQPASAPGEVLHQVARTWRPAPTRSFDPLDPGPSAALSAVLDLPAPAAEAGARLPPLWHWLHFLQWPRHSELGSDGHLRDSHFLPPIPDRRRMFAGGRLEIHTPLIVGRPAELTSSVAAVEVKEGRSGELLFVTVRGDFRQDGGPSVTEEVDLVYRSGGQAPVPPGLTLDTAATPTAGAPWQQSWQTDPALLFRFSALTANAHRIHYDEPYATATEGYPGLVVHGPLLVLSMLELLRREAPGRTVRRLSYRLRQPVFCGERLLTCGESSGGDEVRLRVAGCRADAHATAEATLA